MKIEMHATMYIVCVFEIRFINIQRRMWGKVTLCYIFLSGKYLLVFLIGIRLVIILPSQSISITRSKVKFGPKV